MKFKKTPSVTECLKYTVKLQSCLGNVSWNFYGTWRSSSMHLCNRQRSVSSCATRNNQRIWKIWIYV